MLTGILRLYTVLGLVAPCSMEQGSEEHGLGGRGGRDSSSFQRPSASGW